MDWTDEAVFVDASNTVPATSEMVKTSFPVMGSPFIGKNKSKVIPVVYLFVVEDEIKYIGESRRGYSRPLSYNKNKVMLKQRKAIETILKQGKTVGVYALEIKNEKTVVNGMEIESYLAQDYEKALIRKYKPEWNART